MDGVREVRVSVSPLWTRREEVTKSESSAIVINGWPLNPAHATELVPVLL